MNDIKYNQMEYEKLVKNIVEVLHVDAAELKPETTFVEDLGADSLDLYQILIGMEEELHITVDDEEVVRVRTIDDAMKILTAQAKSKKRG